MDIARIGPADWRTFRAVRLASLSESPAAFGSRYADWVDAPAAKAYERAGFVDVGVPEGWPADEPRERRMERSS